MNSQGANNGERIANLRGCRDDVRLQNELAHAIEDHKGNEQDAKGPAGPRHPSEFVSGAEGCAVIAAVEVLMSFSS